MSNELAGELGHSAEYFGDTRDFWWNVHDVGWARWVEAATARVADAAKHPCGVVGRPGQRFEHRVAARAQRAFLHWRA